MLQSRPLYDTDSDAEFFASPASWDRLKRAVEHSFNVALVGARGAGKTTILRQLQRHLGAVNRPVVFVDATGVPDLQQLVARIETEMLGRRGAVRELRDDAALLGVAFAGGPPGSTSLRVVQRLRALAEQPATTVLVDCAHAASAAYELFGRMRDELWHMEHRWVVAVEDSERSLLLSPPADAFFDQVIAVETTRADRQDILKRRAPALPSDTIERIAEQTDTPRAALQAARDAVLSPGAEDPLAIVLWRQEQAAQLGRPHSMAMHELEALGGASASDEEFLRRMGWSRPRASQVLGDLAEANLVVAVDERSSGGRRPRRVYRPADPPPDTTLPASNATELEVETQ